MMSDAEASLYLPLAMLSNIYSTLVLLVVLLTTISEMIGVTNNRVVTKL